MRHITVYMSDGDTISTSINGTDEEIIRHYLGNRFEAGSDTKHHYALCSVRMIRGVREEEGECIWLTVSDTEYSLDDVWVYDLNGEWIKGIGYKHATAS